MENDLKVHLKQFYDQEAAYRDRNTIRPDWKARVRQEVLDQAKAEGKETLLELGAGAGYDSQFFQLGGLRVTAVDLSGEMTARCREKGVEAYEMDFCQLSSLGRTFDCVYTLNALLHVPAEDLRQVLAEIDAVLNPDGLVYIGVYSGEDQVRWWVKEEISSAPRFFMFYAADTLRTVLEEFFEVLRFETYPVGEADDLFHSILLRKRA